MGTVLYRGYRVDPENGIVYGKRGQPIRKVMNGYVWVMAGRNGVSHSFAAVHRMVWESVHGPLPDGLEVNHIDGNKANNRIDNLESVTPSENIQHAYRLGLICAEGEKNGRAILCPADVRAIRASSDTCAALARTYGVSTKTISDARNGRAWRNVA